MLFDLSWVSTHLTYNCLIGLVALRPISWITSIDPATPAYPRRKTVAAVRGTIGALPS